MPSATIRGLIATLSLCVLAHVPSHGFGALGHQVAAGLAEDMLTPKAKSEVVKLLAPAGGSTSLASISVWADEVKSLRPQTRAWHYITIQIDAAGPKADPARADTPNVVTALERQLAILKRADADRYAREEALKWVVHLIGDLHQPLHTGEDHDKGGNLMQVRVNRRAYNLHAVWDYVLLERLKLPADSIKLMLEREIAAEPIWLDRNAQGTPAEWAKATHKLAAACYLQRGKPLKKGIKSQLEKDYVREATLVSLAQLKLAGARMAFALNNALDSGGFGTGLRAPEGRRPAEDDYFNQSESLPADSGAAADGRAGARTGAKAKPQAPTADDGGESPAEEPPAKSGSAEQPRSDAEASRESNSTDVEPPAAREPERAVPRAETKGPKKEYREAKPTLVYKRFAWSANSKVYHLSICADVRRILRKNLETEDHAPSSRTLHPGCPVP